MSKNTKEKTHWETKKKIYETTNYAMFKKLEGNRAVKDRRVDRIVESINKIGYVTSPILVNEHMEVIDGQGRLSALERLHMPVEYIIHEGVSIEECRQMNIHQSNWTDYDYVQSYAVRGDEDYQRLQSLMDNFKDLPTSVIIAAAGELALSTTQRSNRVRGGHIKLTEQEYGQAKWELGYAEQFAQVAKNIGGSKAPFYIAILYAYRNLDTDGRNRMADVVRKNMLEFPTMSQVDGYLKYFDTFYNEGLRSKNKKTNLALQWAVETQI